MGEEKEQGKKGNRERKGTEKRKRRIRKQKKRKKRKEKKRKEKKNKIWKVPRDRGKKMSEDCFKGSFPHTLARVS